MTTIFFSHAVSDGKGIAAELVTSLEAAGHACWVAPRDLTPGRTYPAQITAAIRDSIGLILLVTAGANRSTDVLQEVQIAHTHGKTIIPIIVDGAKLSDDLSYFLSVRQQLPWTTPSDVLPAIVRSIVGPKPGPVLGSSSAPSPVMSPMDAIAAAAANEGGVTGAFRLVVRSTGVEGKKLWLSSEADYRDPRCLSVEISNAIRQTLSKLFQEDPSIFLRDKIVLVRGTARKEQIDFLSGGKASGAYYFQTHIKLEKAADLELCN